MPINFSTVKMEMKSYLQLFILQDLIVLSRVQCFFGKKPVF